MLQGSLEQGGTALDRPVAFRKRVDLDVAWMDFRGRRYAVLKDPLSLRYHRLSPDQHGVLARLDGERSLRQIRADLQREFPSEYFALADVQGVILGLQEKGLLTALRMGQGPTLAHRERQQRRRRLFAALRNPLSIQLPGWDPDRFLTRLEPLVGWLFRPLTLLLAGGAIAAALVFVAAHFRDVQNRLPEFQRFFGWPNLLFLWLTLAAIKVVHELGHGFACKHFGRECHSIGVMLLVFSPTMYCDVTDAWMLRSKWERILVSAAGMYFEALLSTAALVVWWNTEPGLLHFLCLNTFFVSAVSTVIFNANPLLRYDGYYILSDLLEIPNLRQTADRLMQRTMVRAGLGIELPPQRDLPQSGRLWFLLYVVASAVYRWIVFGGILTFFYTVLKPYRLQSLGIVIAVATVGLALGGTVMSFVKMLKEPRRDPLSPRRLLLASGVLAASLTGLLLLPFPWSIEAPFYVEPVGAVHLYNTVAGEIAERGAGEGDPVAAGGVVLVLDSPEFEARLDAARTDHEAAVAEAEAWEAAGRPDAAAVAQQRVRSTRETLDQWEEESRRRVVRSPIAGRVCAPPRVAPPTLEVERERLPGWSGTPLDRKNLGAFLPEQTHVATIAPTERWQAVLVMDQTEREALLVDRPVRLKLEELPQRVLDGRIAEISHRHLEFAPRGLSNRYGGPLVTVTDPQGREKLTSVTYQAIVPLDIEPDLARNGMRGTARIHLADRSLGEWIWRAFWTTFQFRL